MILMNFNKVSLRFGDRKLCQLLLPRKLCFLVRTNRFFSLPKFKNKFLNYKCLSTYSNLKMSTNTSSLDLFIGKEDRFEGITVVSDLEPCDVSGFPEKLKNSLEAWRSTKKRGIWFKVHLNQCEWVPMLVKNSFKYHHAKEEYVMLYLWLPSHESNNVPNYAHTMVGVGAVVVSDSDQILVVKEKYFYRKPMWKLPGGYVEPGENLVDAAVREVLEETGIQATFESVLSLRHTHGGMFGCSDIYVVVHLNAVNEVIQKCEREISECKWMDIEEYLGHPLAHELNRFFVQKLLDHRKHNLKIDCLQGIHQLLQKPYTVYSVAKMDDVEESASISHLSVTEESSKSS